MKKGVFNLANEEEIKEWSKRQDIVKVSCIKVGEEDKFVYTIGEYVATPHVFDTQQEAIDYLEENFKLTNMDLVIIGTMNQKLSQVYTEINKNKEL